MHNLKFVHTGISVTDLERSIAWYKDIFGFEEVKRFEKPDLEIKGAALKRGDCVLEILEPYKPQTISNSEKTIAGVLQKIGANHFAISVEDVQSFYSELKSKNVDLVSEIKGNKFFFCRDPDGTVIEVRQS